MHIFIFAALATGAWQEPGAPVGPTAYYPLDEASIAGTAAEYSGGPSGTYVGSPTPLTTVNPAITYANPYCLNFSGSGQCVKISNFGTFTNMSVSVWVNRSSEPSGRQSIVSYKEGDGVNCGFVLCVSESGTSGLPRIWVQVNGSWLFAEGNAKVQVGQWTHLVGTYDGAAIKLYVNGATPFTTNAAGAMTNSGTQDCVIGARADSTSNFFPGRIDDVRIYDRALSLLEVQILAAGCPVPQSLTATSTTPMQIQLTWAAPTGPTASYTYRVKRKATGDPVSAYTTIATLNSLSYTDTAPWVTSYDYAVTAVSAAESGLSASQTITPMIPIPRTQEVGNEHTQCGCGSTFPLSGAGWMAAAMAVLLIATLRRA